MYDDDPLGQLGYLQSSSFRACRLVVDNGLHTKRGTASSRRLVRLDQRG